MSERFSFTVDRSKWFRGQGWAKSQLLREDGTMCCLGFYAKACGARDWQIVGVGGPSRAHGFWPDWMFNGSLRVPDVMEMMSVNDERMASDSERELALTQLFAAHGVDVTFVDGAP